MKRFLGLALGLTLRIGLIGLFLLPAAVRGEESAAYGFPPRLARDSTRAPEPDPLLRKSAAHRPLSTGKLLAASGISLAATAVPITAGALLVKSDGSGLPPLLIFTGLLVGPSIGQFYLGDDGHGWGAIGLRAAGSGFLAWGTVLSIADAWDERSSSDATVPLLIGFAAFSTGFVYSFVQPWITHPQAESGAASSRFDLLPTVARDADGRRRYGLKAQLGF